MSAVRFGVLGPLEADRDGVAVRLGGPRPRAVLAALLLAHGRVVRMDTLVDAVWGDAPPDTAVKTVQKYVSHLRAQLGVPGLIASRGDGYALATVDMDSRLFEDLIARAEVEPTPERTAALLTEALDLWRGEPYGDLPDLAAAHAERRRLAEQRMTAVEALAEARLALRQHGALIGWLEELVAGNPLRERLWGALILALYRCGRQAEALAAYQRLRAMLVEELGTEPTPLLRALHERILRQEDETPCRPRATNLPLHLTSFVGRDAELGELAGGLAAHRLVTLTGPAGSGKTRLAVELLAGSTGARPDGARTDGAWPDGAWFVELAGLTDPGRVPSAVAATLRLGEQAGREFADIVADHVSDKCLLLVLDNCEHLIDAAADLVARVLRTAARVSVLATSRQPLGVAGELVLDVPPLSVPATDDPTDVEASGAVRLLVLRARSVDARFAVTVANAAAVARIARRLDGMPLALELAAARLRVFDAPHLADLLDDRFRVLVSTQRTAPARHHTLRAAVAWSYDALAAEEQALFRALSVFDGGFTLKAAQAVGGTAGTAVALLPALVERSLVVVDRRGDATRYRLLETLREYARAQLDPEESTVAHRRHLHYHLDLAERAAAGLHGPGHLDWLDTLDPERDNLRAALRWSLTHGERDAGLRLAIALAAYWDEQAQYSEGVAWLRDAMADSVGISAELRVLALAGAARLAIGQGDHGQAAVLAGESLALARRVGDEPGTVRATALLGNVALYQGNYAEADPLLTDSATAFGRLGLRWAQAEVIGRLGHLNRLRGDYPAAGTHLERSLALRTELGDRTGQAWTVWQLGVLARYQGADTRAEALYADSLTRFEELADVPGAAHVRYSMGDLARLRADHSLAERLYTTSLAQLRQHGDQRCVASVLFNLGALALDRKDPTTAAPLLEQSLALRRQLNDQAGIAECLEAFAAIAEIREDPAAAVRLLSAAEAVRARTGAARPASDDRVHAAQVEALRAAVGADAFDAAWGAGQGSPRADRVPRPAAGFSP